MCVFCGQPISPNERSDLTERGLSNIIQISREKMRDGLADTISNYKCPIPAHKRCKNSYRLESSARKKQKTHHIHEPVSRMNRSFSAGFDIKTDCLYCGKEVKKHHKLKQAQKADQHSSKTIPSLKSIESKIEERDDDWANTVRIRVQNIGDLVAAEAVYHGKCYSRFHSGRSLETVGYDQCGRSKDEKKAESLLKLCKFIENSTDVHQYSTDELQEKLIELGGEDVYGPQYMQKKLIEYFGSSLHITYDHGKNNIFTFLDKTNQILRDHYARSGLTPEIIIDMAGTLIEDEIRTSTTYDKNKFPKFSDMDNCSNMVSPLLMQLLSKIIKSKRRQVAIAHSITASARPKSFVSPILLALAFYISRKYESRELIDILNALGFSDDYREVLRLLDALMPDQGDNNDPALKQWDDDSILNLIFDNGDIDTRTLTGLDTWHVMCGAAVTTPGKEYVEPELKRSFKIRKAEEIGDLSEIPIKHYSTPAKAGLAKVNIKPLNTTITPPTSHALARRLDVL